MTAMLIWTTLILISEVVESSDYNLVILHHTDIHSIYGRVDIWGLRCRNSHYQIQLKMKCIYGGFPRAVKYVRNIKNDKFSPNSLVLNSGDFFKGDTMHIAFKWEVAAAMAKHMPYDAITIGDKEFTEGIDGLMPFLRAFDSMFVCTNMDFNNLNSTLKKELLTLCPRHRIITLSGKKIALFGYLRPNSVTLSKLGGIRLEDEVEALTREVTVVQGKGANILIALGHSGYERDQEIAVQVTALDVIVGGSSHTLLWPDIFSEQAAGQPPDPADTAEGPYPTVIRTDGHIILIVNAYKTSKYVGNINVTFDDKGDVKDWWAQPALMQPDMEEDTATRKTLDEFKTRLEEWSRATVGVSLVQLVGLPAYCLYGECIMGNFVTDAILWAMRVDAGDEDIDLPMVAIFNSGGIHNSLPLGNITINDMDRALPFRSKVEIIIINGSSLWEAFEHGKRFIDETGRLLQVSGARVVYNTDMPEYSRVMSVDVLCRKCPIPTYQPLNMSHMYAVAAPEWITNGNDEFTMLTHYTSRIRPLIDIDLVERYLRQMSPVYPVLDDRIRVITNNTRVEHAGTACSRANWGAAVALVLIKMLV